MPTGRLILLLLLIVAAAVVVVLVLRRGSAKRDEQRVEAAGIRGEAEGMAATLTGQDTFAQQAEERAEVARLEAEERAREAARLEAEAAEQRAAAEATRREYEATMRHADDVDPDVKESAFAPVPDAGSHVAQEAPDTGSDASDAGDTQEVLLSRAERRQAREHEGESSWAAPSGPGAVAAGAAAAGAAGASTWAARDEEEASPESQRIASAADYRDDVPDGGTGAGSSTEVYEPLAAGSGAAMSQDSRKDDRAATDDLSEDTQSPSGEWGGPRADVDAATETSTSAAPGGTDDDVRGPGEPGDVAIVSDTDAYASTEPLPADEQTPPVEPVAPAATGAAEGERTASDASAGRDRTTGDEAADRDRTTGDETAAADEAGAGEATSRSADEVHRAGGGEADLQIVSDTDAYASTEPLPASDAEPAPKDEIDSDRTDADDRTGDHAPAETGAAVAETNETDTERSGSDAVASEPTEERYDPTPTRDWSADEADLLAENRDRGDRLADDRQDLEAEDDRLSGIAAREGATASGTGATASDTDATASDAVTDETPTGDDDAVDQAVGRRVSEFDELRDGGYGVGSAAPLDDGAQPLDHPIQGYRDSMTFRAPGDAGYDSAEPDVWFYDEAAAERNGFRRGDG